ncbi:hypothetical protein AKJ16_DCAP17560 [Drosera capensis]
MQVALSTLFNLQTSILNRISKLELTHFPQLLSSAVDCTETDSATVERLSAILRCGEAQSHVTDCTKPRNSKYYVVVVQVILNEAIVNLSPDFFWLGGGEVDLKMGIRTTEFIDFVKPFIVKCTS